MDSVVLARGRECGRGGTGMETQHGGVEVREGLRGADDEAEGVGGGWGGYGDCDGMMRLEREWEGRGYGSGRWRLMTYL